MLWMAKLRRSLLASVLVASLGGTVATAPAVADDAGYWPEDEDDQRLKELDNEVLRLQKARFQAIFSDQKDDKEVQRLREELKKTQKARAGMLRKTGRY